MINKLRSISLVQVAAYPLTERGVGAFGVAAAQMMHQHCHIYGQFA